ncbi:MAG: hypothetical protein ACRDJS_10445 [Actinomycetota bacterium]
MQKSQVTSLFKGDSISVRRLIAIGALATMTASLAGVTSVSASPGAGRLPIRVAKDAVPLGEGKYAIELKAPKPTWYTNELHRRVVAAAKRGQTVVLPDGAHVETSLLFTGIRPGSWMISPAGCTMNYVFGRASGNVPLKMSRPAGKRGKGAKRRARVRTGSGAYIGTAGHCTEVGDEVTLIAAPGVLMNIGRTVKSIDRGIGNDFALVEVHPQMVQYVNPSMAHVGGPTGAGDPVFGDPVVHTGHGAVIGTGGTPRPGLVTWEGAERGREVDGYGWDGAAIFGDSGSPVRHANGVAVGNLTHLVIAPNILPAFIAGTNISRIKEIAAVPLATASLIPDPLP